MRVRGYDSKETLDAETRADDLNAHRITRLSLDMGIATMRWYAGQALLSSLVVLSKCFSIG